MCTKTVPADNIHPPLSMEELEQAAQRYVRKLHLSHNQAEDAVQIFVTAGVRVLSAPKAPGNMPGFQVTAGKRAVINYLRAEHRHNKRVQLLRERKLADYASQLSTGDIVDLSANTPPQILIRREEADRARMLLRRLTDREQLIIREIVMEGNTAEELATRMRGTVSHIQSALCRALKKMRARFVLEQLPSSRARDHSGPTAKGESDHESTE